jgi:hypothetical protein
MVYPTAGEDRGLNARSLIEAILAKVDTDDDSVIVQMWAEDEKHMRHFKKTSSHHQYAWYGTLKTGSPAPPKPQTNDHNYEFFNPSLKKSVL